MPKAGYLEGSIYQNQSSGGKGEKKGPVSQLGPIASSIRAAGEGILVNSKAAGQPSGGFFTLSTYNCETT